MSERGQDKLVATDVLPTIDEARAMLVENFTERRILMGHFRLLWKADDERRAVWVEDAKLDHGETGATLVFKGQSSN